MTSLLLATANPGKVRELRAILAALDLEVLTAADLDLIVAVEETGSTFQQNAEKKARAYAGASGLPALADDSGLEVDALGGFPGVRSSRWVAGADADRVAALLRRLEGVPAERRGARFRSAAVLAQPDGWFAAASGSVEGRIATEPRGSGGFGYDPVFLVEDGGWCGDKTMAELAPGEKSRVSHRARALRGLWPALEALANSPE